MSRRCARPVWDPVILDECMGERHAKRHMHQPRSIHQVAAFDTNFCPPPGTTSSRWAFTSCIILIPERHLNECLVQGNLENFPLALPRRLRYNDREKLHLEIETSLKCANKFITPTTTTTRVRVPLHYRGIWSKPFNVGSQANLNDRFRELDEAYAGPADKRLREHPLARVSCEDVTHVFEALGPFFGNFKTVSTTASVVLPNYDHVMELHLDRDDDGYDTHWAPQCRALTGSTSGGRGAKYFWPHLFPMPPRGRKAAASADADAYPNRGTKELLIHVLFPYLSHVDLAKIMRGCEDQSRMARQEKNHSSVWSSMKAEEYDECDGGKTDGSSWWLADDDIFNLARHQLTAPLQLPLQTCCEMRILSSAKPCLSCAQNIDPKFFSKGFNHVWILVPDVVLMSWMHQQRLVFGTNSGMHRESSRSLPFASQVRVTLRSSAHGKQLNAEHRCVYRGVQSFLLPGSSAKSAAASWSSSSSSPSPSTSSSYSELTATRAPLPKLMHSPEVVRMHLWQVEDDDTVSVPHFSQTSFSMHDVVWQIEMGRVEHWCSTQPTLTWKIHRPSLSHMSCAFDGRHPTRAMTNACNGRQLDTVPLVIAEYNLPLPLPPSLLSSSTKPRIVQAIAAPAAAAAATRKSLHRRDTEDRTDDAKQQDHDKDSSPAASSSSSASDTGTAVKKLRRC